MIKNIRIRFFLQLKVEYQLEPEIRLMQSNQNAPKDQLPLSDAVDSRKAYCIILKAQKSLIIFYNGPQIH